MSIEEMHNAVKKDFLGRQVVVTVSRGSRPHDNVHPRAQKVVPPEKCFFCPGNEHLTPPEIDRIEKDGKWEIRCFPNKFPAFDKGSKKAYGWHDVIVETPDHMKTISELSVDNLFDYLAMVKRRMAAAAADPKLKYVCVFKNEGKAAGASLEHSHSQVVAMDFVPKHVQKVGKKASAFAAMPTKQEKNIFLQNEQFAAVCPKISRFPLEFWLLPKFRVASLVELDDSQLRSLAAILKSSLAAFDAATGFGPYNIVFHSAPIGQKDFQFHLQILPRMANWAGFEFATEIVMTSSTPQMSVASLRKAAEGQK
ncbi:MAG: DUF4931 domain-containing protein [Candidatus Anstonellaceae archaeon]